MPEKWNRQTRRQMGRYGIGQKLIADELEKETKKVKEYTYREAFSAMMLALNKGFGFGHDRLHRLAVMTVNNINKSLCPEDMIVELKKRTNFDINEPIRDDELDPLEPSEQL